MYEKTKQKTKKIIIKYLVICLLAWWYIRTISN